MSETEAAAFPIPLELNSDGLPASLRVTGQPNTSIRIPTRLSPGTGQFALLRGLSGTPLRENENGPVDLATHEVVRAMRSGNAGDTNNGFLLDLNAPAIVSGWQIVVENALPDPDGLDGIDWRVDLRFTTPCKGAPEVGDICSVGQNFLEVLVAGAPPDAQDRVLDVRVRALQEIAALKDEEAFDLAVELVGTWGKDERREGAKVLLHALAEKRIGSRDQANRWIWSLADDTQELHEEYAVQRWPETIAKGAEFVMPTMR